MMTPDQIIKTADHAAQMSDRWLFVVTLLVFLLALFLAVRWLMARQDKLEGEIVRVREQYASHLLQEGQKTSALLARCVDVLEDLRK